MEEDGRGCIFKILPRYKVQSVGEEVHYNDQVKLESVAMEGQFLHCSRRTFGEVEININKDWLEWLEWLDWQLHDIFKWLK